MPNERLRTPHSLVPRLQTTQFASDFAGVFGAHCTMAVPCTEIIGRMGSQKALNCAVDFRGDLSALTGWGPDSSNVWQSGLRNRLPKNA